MCEWDRSTIPTVTIVKAADTDIVFRVLDQSNVTVDSGPDMPVLFCIIPGDLPYGDWMALLNLPSDNWQKCVQFCCHYLLEDNMGENDPDQGI